MKKILAIAIATAISAPAMADLTIGGSARYQVTDTDGATATAGRVQIDVKGSAAGDNGAFASYQGTVNFNMGGLEKLDVVSATAADYAPENVSFDNVTLTLGNAAANVQVGEFELFKAFSSGADTFEAATLTGSAPAAKTAAIGGYENSSIFGRDSGNIQLNVTAIEGVTLNAATRIQDADSAIQIGAGATFGGVAVAAMYEDDSTSANNGMTVTAGTTFEGVAVNASYGKKGANKSSNINFSYAGFGLAFQNNEGASNVEEDRVFGSYTLEDVAGVAGADVIIGGGNASTAAGADKDVVGVRLSYAF
jgi:hypothetical protein